MPTREPPCSLNSNDPGETPPVSSATLWHWVYAYTGVKIAYQKVCPCHDSPWDYFAGLYFNRPPLALVLGPRGGGKSFLSALNTHVTCRWNPRHGTRILGGSRAQSEQVYRVLRETVFQGKGPVGSDARAITRLLKGEALYRNGSEVAILGASSTSVRGPHVPSLKLDEVDEIDPDLREAAMGMCMDREDSKASVVMTSTWHRVNGPMATLMDQARGGAFPLYEFCMFEVLERCPESRSGPRLEECPSCPLVRYCHDVSDGGLPKAKRSNGHYSIDALIQKLRSTSARTFEADYLCKGPRSDGLWFPGFDETRHVSPLAEFEPGLPVHLAIDSGVFTGAVFFQVARQTTSTGIVEEIRVFAEHLAENLPAERNARAIQEVARNRCQGRLDVISTDPAGGARNPVGPTVIGEYERAGIRPLRRWPVGSVADGLALVESFVDPADGRSRLTIHPRCVATIRALRNYRRARRAGQWQDYPEDPQHPHEDLVDALRGGLRVCFPEGRTPHTSLVRVPARQVF
ncbi:MAG: hypothetical protein AB7I30_16725 [Isosphaeraceae bacterium]